MNSPSIVPGKRCSVHEIPQALHNSEINFRIDCFFDGMWTAALGDEHNGWTEQSRERYYVDAVIALKDMAIKHYPESGFAKNYAEATFVEDPIPTDEELEGWSRSTASPQN